MESAHTWPVRSTSMAEFSATMRSFCAITKGSLAYAVRWNSKIGLLSMKSNSSFVPSTNPAITLRGCSVFRSLLITPASDQVHHTIRHHFGVDPQVFVIAQQPQHRFRNAADAGLNGGAIGDQRRHVACDRAMQVGHACFGYSESGCEVSMNASARLTWRNVSPRVRGIRSLISTIRYLAHCAAVSEASTLGPTLM